MRRIAFLAPLAAALAVSGAAAAQPSAVVVTVSPDFAQTAQELGERDVQQQVSARVELVITDLKPNRPTMQQLSDKPGLDSMRSLSIGGAAVEGSVTMASGEVQPVKFDYYTPTLADARGSTTWTDAQRAYDRLARNLAEGRFVKR
jgi:hypothetical protein